jgi:hypothetical protein
VSSGTPIPPPPAFAWAGSSNAAAQAQGAHIVKSVKTKLKPAKS